MKYIQQETGTRVQIKGLGSGFVEQETGKESEEPMHIHITFVYFSLSTDQLAHKSPVDQTRAKSLVPKY